MASNISFRGEVNEMSAAYFIREMEDLPARSSATIYLHTPGGDIYAGGEMVNALRAACKRGCKFDIELGSLCASMGAALLAAARADGCKVVAHSNSEVMFHGCWSYVVGGADELTDQAKAMRDFNECVRKDLRKCGISDTDEWFSADRQKWLNADELLELGLVDAVVENAAADHENLKSDAVKIAASLNHKQQENPKMDEPKNEAETPVEATPAVESTVATEAPAEEVKPTEAQSDQTQQEIAVESIPETTAEPVAPVAPTEAEIEEKVTALANQRFAGLQAKHEKKICDLVKERDAAQKDLAAANAKVTSLNANIEKLNADLAALRDQLTQSERNHESIVVDALTPSAELPTLTEALAACKTLAERAEVLKSENYKH